MLTLGFNRWGQTLLHFGTSPAALVLDGVVYRRNAKNQHKLMFGDNAPGLSSICSAWRCWSISLRRPDQSSEWCGPMRVQIRRACKLN
jgi:hypothetical protein